MEDSDTYQAILDRGRVDEARRIVLRQGSIRFGEPGPAVLAALEAIRASERLEALADRVLTATSWEDLLA